MNSKIKVDPRTFKIINQSQFQDQSRSQTTTETFTSDSDSGSSTSVKSDTESVKVIKLDNSVQSGGEKPTLTLPSQKITNPNPEVKVQPTQNTPIKTVVTNPNTTLPKVENNNNNNTNLFNYLSIKNTESKPEQEITLSKTVTSDAESDTNENSDNIETENKPTIDEVTEDKTEVQTEKVEDDSQQDVFDLTQNKLYQVLSKLFESTKGDGIGENLDKISKLFETHNQIMEKLLNQLIIMNTNQKQVKVPGVFQSNTKQAGTITDFRKKIDRFDQQPQKKD